MDKPIQGKKTPEVKPWVRRVVAAAGVLVPDTADGEKRLGWWGVELARFLKFCKGLSEGTDLRPAMEGYGRYLKSMERNHRRTIRLVCERQAMLDAASSAG